MNDELVRAKVWRLHFFTGLFLSPFFLVLALTGVVYLFKPQVEPVLYQKWLQVPVGTTRVPYDDQLKTALAAFPGSSLRYVVPPSGEGKTTQFFIKDAQRKEETVYVNPYTGQVTGVQRSDLMLMQLAHDIHGTLLLGDNGALVMEICAGWALILFGTGLYIWWPFRGLWRKALPVQMNSRPSWKAFHGTLGLFASVVIMGFLITGIPWTNVTGKYLSWGMSSIGWGSPPGFGPSPFMSEDPKGRPMVSLDQLVRIVNDRIPGSEPKITYPYDHQHAVVILWASPHPSESAFIHVDAYSGEVIKDFRWKDFGPVGKAISYGISLHQGTLFGVWNQGLNILVAFSVLGLSFSGIWMWWLRRPKNAWLAPPRETNVSYPPVVKLGLLICCLIVPTTGLSLLAIFMMDWTRSKIAGSTPQR